MQLKVLIVDDEPHAREVIDGYLLNFPEVKILASCSNGIEAFKILQQQQIDLMFLDIKMPGISGIELLKSLKNPPKVIFTTAYSEYAVEGFELEAVDYLLKPVSFDRFLKAMDKMLRHFGFNSLLKNATPVKEIINADQFIFVKSDRKTIKIDVGEILWIESQKDYIRIVLKDREIISKNKISIIESLLPEHQFLRIHRSFIIAINHVDSFYAYAVQINNKEIPIGRNYKAEAQQRLRAEI